MCFVVKMREADALQKLLTVFRQEYWRIWDMDVWKFQETLTNEVVNFDKRAWPCYETLSKVEYCAAIFWHFKGYFQIGLVIDSEISDINRFSAPGYA